MTEGKAGKPRRAGLFGANIFAKKISLPHGQSFSFR